MVNLGDLKNLTDNEIIKLINENNKDALEYLINKYKNIVKIISRTYFMIGADKEDVIQEGMIGLYKAIRDYSEDYKTSFSTFSKLCIERQLMTAIKSANRKKHQPLNTYLSLNNLVYEENDEITFLEKIEESNIFNPEEIFINKENVKNIEKLIQDILSEFEKKVLYFYLKGKSYSFIAKILKKDEKSIDNAIQRIRKKILKSNNLNEVI